MTRDDVKGMLAMTLFAAAFIGLFLYAVATGGA